MYLELGALLGELAGLHPDRDPFVVAEYDHDNPAIAFSDLSNRIRSLLRGAVAPRFMHVPFVLENELMVAALTDEHLTVPNEYFLGIKTEEDARAVTKLVEDGDRFKLMARSMATMRVYGVKLTEERNPPLGLPTQIGLHYYRLLRDEGAAMWGRIKQDKAMAINWTGMESSDFAMTLYMTIPEGG